MDIWQFDLSVKIYRYYRYLNAHHSAGIHSVSLSSILTLASCNLIFWSKSQRGEITCICVHPQYSKKYPNVF